MEMGIYCFLRRYPKIANNAVFVFKIGKLDITHQIELLTRVAQLLVIAQVFRNMSKGIQFNQHRNGLVQNLRVCWVIHSALDLPRCPKQLRNSSVAISLTAPKIFLTWKGTRSDFSVSCMCLFRNISYIFFSFNI